MSTFRSPVYKVSDILGGNIVEGDQGVGYGLGIPRELGVHRSECSLILRDD